MGKEEKVEHIKGKYLLLVALIGLFGTFALIYKEIKIDKYVPTNPEATIKQSEPQDSNSNKNTEKANVLPSKTQKKESTKPKGTEEKMTSKSEIHTLAQNPEKGIKVENITHLIYTSRIEDVYGNGIAGVEIYCLNCLEKQVKTDSAGIFTLKRYFDINAAFWQSPIVISKNNRIKKETIDFRENSPQPIHF